MKRYTFEVVITEGNHEYWEEILAKGNTGCDELLDNLRSTLDESFANEFEVRLVKYEDK